MTKVQYDWDPAKARTNTAKHGVDFADSVTALEDEFAITIVDPDSQAEERYVSMGSDAMGRLLVTVYTFRGSVIRIISARKASKRERRIYEQCR